MESIKRLSDVDPRDLAVVERVFGQRIETTRDLVLILTTAEAPLAASHRAIAPKDGDVPSWCDVLEGMLEDDLAEFSTTLELPVRMARSTCVDGS